MAICPECPSFDEQGRWLQFDFESDWPYVRTILYCEHCNYHKSYLIDVMEITFYPDVYREICYLEEEE